MTGLRTTRTIVRRNLHVGRRIIRFVLLSLVSMIGLTVVQSAAEPILDDEADRNGRVVFRHFL